MLSLLLAFPRLYALLQPPVRSKRFRSKAYRRKVELCRYLWLAFALPALAFPFPPAWVALALTATISSFIILDETK